MEFPTLLKHSPPMEVWEEINKQPPALDKISGVSAIALTFFASILLLTKIHTLPFSIIVITTSYLIYRYSEYALGLPMKHSLVDMVGQKHFEKTPIVVEPQDDEQSYNWQPFYDALSASHRNYVENHPQATDNDRLIVLTEPFILEQQHNDEDVAKALVIPLHVDRLSRERIAPHLFIPIATLPSSLMTNLVALSAEEIKEAEDEADYLLTLDVEEVYKKAEKHRENADRILNDHHERATQETEISAEEALHHYNIGDRKLFSTKFIPQEMNPEDQKTILKYQIIWKRVRDEYHRQEDALAQVTHKVVVFPYQGEFTDLPTEIYNKQGIKIADVVEKASLDAFESRILFQRLMGHDDVVYENSELGYPLAHYNISSLPL